MTWDHIGMKDGLKIGNIHQIILNTTLKTQKKNKHEETDYFLYYSIIIDNKKYWANVKMHKDYKGEVLYTIEPQKPKDIILGMPNNENDGMR